jgi:hypothetical protein
MNLLTLPFVALTALAPHRVIERPSPPPTPPIHDVVHVARPPEPEPRPCKCIEPRPEPPFSAAEGRR